MSKRFSRNKRRGIRHARVRKKITGTAVCPRLAVYRSNKHIYAQVIDDEAGKTVAAASTVEKAFEGFEGTFTERAAKVGALVADRAKEHNVTEVVFDRGGFLYHGKVAAVAAGARENGLDF